jgi:hypothetical protein
VYDIIAMLTILLVTEEMFYTKFDELKKVLNMQKASNYAELSAGGIAILMRNELVTLGEKLMMQNPEFSRMYYGVFAGILKEAK